MTAAEENVEKPFAPEKTSIAQVAAGIKKAVKMGLASPGMFTVDVGGGKYDYGTEYLRGYGITNLVYDSYARGYIYNKKVLDEIYARGGADVVFLNNVLNVIPNRNEQKDVIRFSYGLLKPGGVLIITVYEGDRSGVGKAKEYKTGWTWQENRPTTDYDEEIKEALPDTTIDFRSRMYIIHKNMTVDEKVYYPRLI
jgi:SAM-dependent methyltransferase